MNFAGPKLFIITEFHCRRCKEKFVRIYLYVRYKQSKNNFLNRFVSTATLMSALPRKWSGTSARTRNSESKFDFRRKNQTDFFYGREERKRNKTGSQLEVRITITIINNNNNNSNKNNNNNKNNRHVTDVRLYMIYDNENCFFNCITITQKWFS
jgi:hypothetical protein